MHADSLTKQVIESYERFTVYFTIIFSLRMCNRPERRPHREKYTRCHQTGRMLSPMWKGKDYKRLSFICGMKHRERLLTRRTTLVSASNSTGTTTATRRRGARATARVSRALDIKVGKERDSLNEWQWIKNKYWLWNYEESYSLSSIK